MWLILFQDRGGAFLYSLFVGALIGWIYDLFRVSRVFFGRGKIKVFFEDLVFCLMCTVLLCVFIFNATMGMIRLFAFCGISVGFFFHYFTFGKITVGIARFLRRLVSPYVLKLKLRFHKASEALKASVRSAALRRRLLKKASAGFDSWLEF